MYGFDRRGDVLLHYMHIWFGVFANNLQAQCCMSVWLPFQPYSKEKNYPCKKIQWGIFLFVCLVHSNCANANTNIYTYENSIARPSNKLFICICWRSHPNTQFVIMFLSFYTRAHEEKIAWSGGEQALCSIKWQYINVLSCKNAIGNTQ